MKELPSADNIVLKRLTVTLCPLKWRNVMKSKFSRKYKIRSSCISRICRQLLNMEIRKRRLLLNSNYNLVGKLYGEAEIVETYSYLWICYDFFVHFN